MAVMLVAGQPHPLEPEQAQRLVKIARLAKDRVRSRRAGIVFTSVQGRSAADIAVMFAATDGSAPEVIHTFDETSFRSTGPNMQR